MAKAKKLHSGSWRCQVYSHTEEILMADGSRKKKRIYKSFTCFNATMAMFTDTHFKIKLPQKRQNDIYIPSDQDIKLLLEHAEGDFLLALYLGAFAGLRRGEICALDRSDVFDGYISINKSMGLTQNRTWEIKQPKTESSN